MINYDMFRCPGRELKECANCDRKLSPWNPNGYQCLSLGEVVEGNCVDFIDVNRGEQISENNSSSMR
jgi:hypothetical protein